MHCEVAMPSVDHCMNQPSEMTTLTNSLEVFDTYKHREDKDSDEESFHLPLDDDESESKYQEIVKNGSGNETEDDILNKFDSTASACDPIDPQLEERLLNDIEEEKKSVKINGNSEIPKSQTDSAIRDSLEDSENESTKCNAENDKNDCTEKDDTVHKSNSSVPLNHVETPSVEESEVMITNSLNEESTKVNGSAEESESVVENDELKEHKSSKDELVVEDKDVPIVDVNDIAKSKTEDNNESKQGKNEDLLKEIDSAMEAIVEKETVEEQPDKSPPKDSETKDNQTELHDDKNVDKCENSNDSTKHQNEDSEDLFDISIIRDAEEDNAESAYNEANQESHIDESEDYDDRNDDKMEDDFSSDKVTNLEEDEEEEEMDIDKHEDQLKSDDVEIEETNLNCESIKDAASDAESDSNNRTNLVQTDKGQVQDINETPNSVKQSVECRLDEITGDLIGAENVQTDKANDAVEKTVGVDSDDSEKRKSLKRVLSAEGEGGVAKKSRTESTTDSEVKEVEKPKEKLPLRTLLSLSDFMKSKKNNRRLTMHDLEEFCVQKICEVIVHKSDLGDVHHQLKLQEQLIETMRKEIQQLTKQARDLEIVNKKLMNDLKQQNATQKPLNPLKITRSVGLQVKFTPTFETNAKRRQVTQPASNQKAQVQPVSRGPRNIPTAVTPTVNRQITSPQKQQQVLPKPNTPLLSQALQNRRTVTDSANKSVSQPVRAKAPEPKSGTPTASVIDLTDEDDKKEKNKQTPQKVVTQKNIAVPLRTPLRVNTTQGLRLATSQGKVSPITSVVTSSAPQVMYVVQSSPQNVLSPLGPKAVVVNFQSANGVLTSALNGSAVSVIPKQSNTIQLKAVAATKPATNNKIAKPSNKHPAPLPPPPVVRVSVDKPLKPIPPKPHLTIRKTDTGIILQWKMPYELEMYEVIASYQLYAYQETSALPSTDMWRKVGDVKALALPMACTLTQFADKNKYYFAVRPVDIHKRIGLFSEPEEISL